MLGILSWMSPGKTQAVAQGVGVGEQLYDELRTLEGVDTTDAEWLHTHLAREEAARLFAAIQELSPDSIQLLQTYFQKDPSYAYLMAWPELRDTVDSYLERLPERRPAGAAGVVHFAFIVSRIRFAILDQYANLPHYRVSFAGETLRLPSVAPPPARFQLELDFGPAETLLGIIGSPHVTRDSIRSRVRGEVFDALLQHRGQDFYPVTLNREDLVLSLARASGNSSLEWLYRYTFPVGLLHFADVREHLAEYRALVDTLEAREGDISAHVASRTLPYVPPELSFSRTVHFLFADGADGWASDGVAAIDLEFFKDDFDRLVTLLTHETFHAVQTATRQPAGQPPYADRRQELFVEALESIYREGTATFVAPPQEKTDAERARLAAEGAILLDDLHRAVFADSLDEEKVRELNGRGVQGAGPFYWLGREMSAAIVDAFGPGRVAEALEQGGVRFFELYLEATAESRQQRRPLFSEELVRSVYAM